MFGFKIFDENHLKKNEKMDEVITTWLNENNFEIIQINQSTYPDGYHLISFYYSTCSPHSNT